VHGVGASGKAAVGIEDIVADRLRARETFVADSKGIRPMLGFTHQVRHNCVWDLLG
jgi:hypothetical protein